MNRSVWKYSVMAACLATTIGLHAQMDVIASPMPMQGPGAGVVGFHMEIGGPEEQVIKGQPFSAEISNTFVQTLADGNRITNTSTSYLYRDSEGRTRRENTLMIRGSGKDGKDAPKIIMIDDPVAGTKFIVDDNFQTARKVLRTHKHKGGHPAKRVEKIRAEAGSFAIATPAMGAVFAGAPDPTEEQKTEDLGEKTIEGVLVKGTRLTRIIPAGAIGNEKPITTFTEVWRSAELGIDMLKIHNDPWSGEVTTKVTNIARGEPDGALFSPPADYKVMDGKHGDFTFRTFEKKLPPPPPPPTE